MDESNADDAATRSTTAEVQRIESLDPQQCSTHLVAAWRITPVQ